MSKLSHQEIEDILIRFKPGTPVKYVSEENEASYGYVVELRSSTPPSSFGVIMKPIDKQYNFNVPLESVTKLG